MNSLLKFGLFVSLSIPTVAIIIFSCLLISNLRSIYTATPFYYYALILLSGIFDISITLFIFSLIKRSLANSLSKIHDWSIKIKSGDLTTRLTFSPKSDLYFIAESFNKMADIVEDLLSENTRKVELLNEQNKILEKKNNDLVMALVSAIEARDKYTSGHSERVSKYATQIAKNLDLPQEDVEEIRVAAMLHDLGKIGISDTILNKPTKLSSDEYEEVKRHPSIGSWILNSIHLSDNTLNAINYHHERYDGKGYPLGLSGKDLSLGAQIISLSDAYDAMTSDRPYRVAMSHKKAIEEINKCSYTQFNPELVAMIERDNLLNSSTV